MRFLKKIKTLLFVFYVNFKHLWCNKFQAENIKDKLNDRELSAEQMQRLSTVLEELRR